MRAIRMLAAAAAVMAVTAGGTFAQDAQGPWGPGMMGGGYGPGMMGYGGGPGMMGYGGPGPWMSGSREGGDAFCSAMLGQIDGRLAYIKAELKITADQETLWNAYAAATRDRSNAMLARCTAMVSRRSGSTISLPDRLNQDEQFMTAQLEALRLMTKAVKPLYAALSDSQKKTADQLFWGPMGMM
jgi:LTXXQ motif family protein